MAPSIVRRSDTVVSQSLTGEEGAVLLHLGTGHYHTLNGLGARIWALLESPRSEADLNRELVGEYEVEPDVLARDVRGFLEELADRKLVERDDAP